MEKKFDKKNKKTWKIQKRHMTSMSQSGCLCCFQKKFIENSLEFDKDILKL